MLLLMLIRTCGRVLLLSVSWYRRLPLLLQLSARRFLGGFAGSLGVRARRYLRAIWGALGGHRRLLSAGIVVLRTVAFPVLSLVVGFSLVSMDQFKVWKVFELNKIGSLLGNLLTGKLHIICDHGQAPLQLWDLLLAINPGEAVSF